jgi:hypothetical protein
MKSDDPSCKVSRRTLVSSLALFPALAGTLLSSSARAQVTQGEPLASWNDSPAKQAILAASHDRPFKSEIRAA